MYLWLRENFNAGVCPNTWCHCILFNLVVLYFISHFVIMFIFYFLICNSFVTLCAIVLKALHWGHILILHWNVLLSNGYCGLDHDNCVSFDRGNNLDCRKKNSFFYTKIFFNPKFVINTKEITVIVA